LWCNDKIFYSVFGLDYNIEPTTTSEKKKSEQKQPVSPRHVIVKNGSKGAKKLWKCRRCEKTYRTFDGMEPHDDSACLV